MNSENLSPCEFSLPDDIAEIVRKGQSRAQTMMAAKISNSPLIAASFYQAYWLVTRRIRRGAKEDLHRPLLYAAIEAAAAICVVARLDPQPPDETTFNILLAENPETIAQMHLDAKVLAEDASGFYKRFLHGKLGFRLIDCLDLSMTKQERVVQEDIKKTLKRALSVALD